MKIIPYGKVKSNYSEIYLFIGIESWRKARDFQLQRPGTLCLPAYLPPFDFLWPVKDHSILIFDTSWCHEDYVEDIVKCLFVYGATKVSLVNTDNQFFVFKKE